MILLIVAYKLLKSISVSKNIKNSFKAELPIALHMCALVQNNPYCDANETGQGKLVSQRAGCCCMPALDGKSRNCLN